jgi:hypothetical protein
LRRTIQFIFAIAKAANFHLPASKFSLAQNAKTFVVERHPASTPIFGAQNRKPIIEIEMSDHSAMSSLLTASEGTIGTVADCVVG